MIRILEQTPEEKTAMYMKLTKKELIKILIECNKLLDLQTKSKNKLKCNCNSGYWDGYKKCEIHNK